MYGNVVRLVYDSVLVLWNSHKQAQLLHIDGLLHVERCTPKQYVTKWHNIIYTLYYAPT